jgi:DNA-directed RNA polymerase specialized sigma subunit
MEIISNDLMERFERLSREGIAPAEVKAAVERLQIETGKKPTLGEVAEYLERHVEWRKLVKRERGGEITIVVVETPAGRLASKIGKSVNAIFQKRKGVNQ